MTRPPRPDKMPGPIRTKKPTGKAEDRPLEKIHHAAASAVTDRLLAAISLHSRSV